MFNYYLFNKNDFFFYKEANVFLFYTRLGIVKIKKHELMNMFIKNYFYYLYNLSLFTFNFFKSFIKTINFGHINKLKMVGIGYKRFYNNNFVTYKLRYSHLIYKTIPFNLLTFKKKKKRKWTSFFSLNKEINNTFFYKVLLYRVSNVYTKKGFFKIHQKVNFKKAIL